MIGMGGHCVGCGHTVYGHCVRGSVGKPPPPGPPPQCAQTVGIGGQRVGFGGQTVGTDPQIVGSAGHCVGRGQIVCGQLVIGSVGKLMLACAATSSPGDDGGTHTVSGAQIVGIGHCVTGIVGNCPPAPVSGLQPSSGQMVFGHAVGGSVGNGTPPSEEASAFGSQWAQTVGMCGQDVGFGGQMVGWSGQSVGIGGHCVGSGQTVRGHEVIGSVGNAAAPASALSS